MDAAELGAFIRAAFTDHPRPAGRTAFRLETLDAYEVASDGNDFGRYLAGEAAPTPARKAPWEARLDQEYRRGLRRSRVRVVHTRPGEVLPAYLEYECAWSYTRNARWEDVRVLDLADTVLTTADRDRITAAGDFWLIADEIGIRMTYDPSGRFLRADAVNAATTAFFSDVKATAWLHAEPFAAWWARRQGARRRTA